MPIKQSICFLAGANIQLHCFYGMSSLYNVERMKSDTAITAVMAVTAFVG